ncbi:MAG TPA: Type 1 glutamine amidotransferase-like domain-containing protein [Kiritimatiellia bacterium]|nr:Type 1 glutamine amidotransferase-like domain-containing protein [Kiritimatiellia bacterium]HPS08642.1 Type 1 glutamine amidotransferase-like domain-containing protein [Kiritimatiellia bacterium]
MSGAVYLLAGNPKARGRKPDPVMRAFFGEVGKTNPRLAYIGTASGDDRSFFALMRSFLRASGADEVEMAPLCGRGADAEDALRVLSRADAVFVSGGDVAEGMDVLRARKGVIACLRERFDSGIPFMGLSAGSIMLSRGWVRWAEEDAGQDMLFECLGFAPIYCDVHGEGDGWDELKALLRLLPAATVGYAIPSGGALRVGEGIVESL